MYKYGFHVNDISVFKSQKGLNKNVIEQISSMKNEPQWMLDFRLNAYKVFQSKPTPEWGGDLSKINYDDIYYYIKPTDKDMRAPYTIRLKTSRPRLSVPKK